ncbi:transglutaminase domain-containing protein [Sphingorhabdus arenilitoris]|uniref:Transglutaminase domain-containing protein n=1 Tax=Sphingorhabdus arenilitoris TaxID=1490041 RepID=A0ABV8RKA1_9SPHN
MRLKINHTTRYQYDTPLDYSLQQVRLTPKDRSGQKIIDWQMTVSGGKTECSFVDQHSNHVDLISIDPGGLDLTIHCEGEVEVTDNGGVVGQHQGFMALWNFRRETPLTKTGPHMARLLAELGDEYDGDIAKAHALSALVLQHVPYILGKTDARTSAESALQIGGGVCQDHAHIFIAAMRKLGFPARYVSGYLMMNDRVNQDATHGWAEAYFDEIGWIGFDISNGYSPDDRYIRIATGFDYKDASPVSGMRYGGSSENLVVQLQVQQ